MHSKLQHREATSRTSRWVARAALVIANVLVATVLMTGLTQAQTYTVLYSFTGGTDGGSPYAGLILDKTSNLYGTTYVGGDLNPYKCRYGCGTIFKLDTSGNETVLHTFTQGKDGRYPWAGLVSDKAGNLYGTTQQGGCQACNGTAFKLNVAGTKYKTLHSFQNNGVDGIYPMAPLVRDADGNLYGTTSYAGAYGQGTIFKLDKDGTFTVLYAFSGGVDGGAPWAGLVLDANGNLYGTARTGGNLTCYYGQGCGTVFKLDEAGMLTVLHTFNWTDGLNPTAGLVRDKAGNLYGTTENGGHTKCHPKGYDHPGCGTVFKLDSSGKYRVLHKFTVEDGANPYAGLVRDAAGNLYGTSQRGGDTTSCVEGCGTVFKLDKAGAFTVLHSFNGTDGAHPMANLLHDATTGDFYGTTYQGGPYASGVVFKLTP